MIIPLFQIDAFADRLFEGNPASVCVLEQGFLPDVIMQRIAAENRHSETAFITPDVAPLWRIKWFTPLKEVELCGHATLAAAHVLFSYIARGSEMAVFESLSGRLSARRRPGGMIELDFPRRPPEPMEYSEPIAKALGSSPKDFLRWKDCAMVVFSTENAIRALSPDFKAIANLEGFQCLAATAPGMDCDFVSRFFAPKLGVDEDPVTGMAHTFLAPFWSQRLDKAFLTARQLSARGGRIVCEIRGQRVTLAGHAVRYSEGFIEL